ncbi:MAG: DUF2878 domain-containing protein [Cellvibrionaceae bacterium]
MNSVTKKVINFVMFQVGWFLCVIMQDQYFLAGIYTVVAIVIHHLFIVDNFREWLGVAVVVAVGVLMDSLFNFWGILGFSDLHLFSFVSLNISVIPFWLACIWMLFAMTLCHGLSWLNSKLLLAALFSAVAGPLSYIAGARLSGGFVSLGYPLWLSIVVLSLFWSVMVPCGFVVMRKLNIFKPLKVLL